MRRSWAACALRIAARRQRTPVALLLSVLLVTLAPAARADMAIDDFRDTAVLSPPRGLHQTTIGSTTVADGPKLSGVLGGTRRIVLKATALMAPGLDRIDLGLVRNHTSLSYASSVGADGALELSYDGGGSGLNANLRDARALAVDITAADSAAVPTTFALTIADTRSSKTVRLTLQQAGTQTLAFPLSAFVGIDLGRVRRITLALDPGASGDVQLGGIRAATGGK